MKIYSAPFWIRYLYPAGLTWSVKTSLREIFLTFDDGPIPEVTPLVLEILEKYKIRATFFCVGENVQKYPEIFEQITKAGHAVGNHTYHHFKAWKTDHETYLADVEHCSALVKSNLFRPPHGQITRKLAKVLQGKYNIILWTALSADYDTTLSPNQCLQNAIRNTRPGSIIVFHDSLKALERMQYALALFIENCQAQGYSFQLLQ